jgi:hypothetical protein
MAESERWTGWWQRSGEGSVGFPTGLISRSARRGQGHVPDLCVWCAARESNPNPLIESFGQLVADCLPTCQTTANASAGRGCRRSWSAVVAVSRSCRRCCVARLGMILVATLAPKASAGRVARCVHDCEQRQRGCIEMCSGRRSAVSRDSHAWTRPDHGAHASADLVNRQPVGSGAARGDAAHNGSTGSARRSSRAMAAANASAILGRSSAAHSGSGT